MPTSSRKAKLFALLSFLVVLIGGGLAACSAPWDVQQSTAPAQPDATRVVRHYLVLFNAGMRGGGFFLMDAVLAPDATLTQSSPEGVTTVVHGLAGIITFYTGLLKQLPGYQWTVENMSSLAPDVVLVYQRAGSPPLRVASRCVQVFVVHNGKIITDDWATYYPGQA